jgi:nucleotide-binding universal stress UspA family protein
MRHFLVPTDFSAAAKNALRYAILLATEFDAALTLAYIHSMPMDPMRMGEISAELYADSERVLEGIADEVRHGGLRVHTNIQLGETVPRLKSIIVDSDIDFIVMGCQGEHYLPDRFVGSTTARLMEEVTVPILAVPRDFEGDFPQRIMWATDSRIGHDVSYLYPLFQIVDLATTPLQVFHYQEKGERELPDGRFREVLDEVRYDFYVQMDDGDSVDSAMRDFIHKTSVDLVAVVHRRVSWLSRVFVSSHTRQAIASVPVPLLILQERRSL